MTAVALLLVLTVATAGVVGLIIRRSSAPAPGRVPDVASTPQQGCPDVDSLDDAAFREWLGVLPAVFDRYIDTGVEDLEIFLADQPARHGGEDPA